MPFKVNVIFEGTTEGAGSIGPLGYSGKPHPFGFSEGYITSTNSLSAEKDFLRQLWAPARAALLPRTTAITGARFYNIGGGQGIPFAMFLPGGNTVTDLVNCAVLAQSNNSNAAVAKRWWIHNIPDTMLVGGEFKPTFFYQSQMATFLNQMGLTSWRGIVRNNLISIVNIDNAGLVTLSANSPFAVGNQVTISRTLLPTGRRVGGTFRVATTGPLATQFTLTGWQFGPSLGGQAFTKSYNFFQVGASGRPTIERAGTKRVGRPFDLYRGRKPRRAKSS